MRITGGQAKGVPIRAPKSMRTRPTSDKVREALFNTLGAEVQGRSVLDLFAGSGALGLEALSRGARCAVFVENDPNAVRVVNDNLAKAALSERAEIITGDFRSALRKLDKKGHKFDLVFVDPPYRSGLLGEVGAALSRRRIISEQAILVIEHFKKTEPPTNISGIPLSCTRHYGQTMLSYFRGGKPPAQNRTLGG